MRSIDHLLRKVLVLIIEIWQRLFSPIFGQNCRFYPTCSAYAKEAIIKKGVVRGSIMAAWRILRCNPFSKGGYDPVDPDES